MRLFRTTRLAPRPALPLRGGGHGPDLPQPLLRRPRHIVS